MGLATEFFDDGSSFFAIDPLSINPDHLAAFSLFERYPMGKGEYRFRCLLTDTESVEKERLISLLASWDIIYIHKKEKSLYTDYVKNNLEFILNHGDIAPEKKTAALVEISSEEVKEAFALNFSDQKGFSRVARNIEVLVTQAMDFISSTESLKGIANLIGHDYATHTHSIKVGWLAATFLNANQDLFDVRTKKELKGLMIQIAVAGFLHDIGKIKIPTNVLNKRGKLKNLEFAVVQCHTAYSTSLLFESGLPRPVLQTILYHHENEDGSGYPCGLAGEEIPLMARICHITDVFDALTSRRPYKKAKTAFEALKLMSGENPHLEILKDLEAEVMENKRVPMTALVRDDYEVKLKRLREREILEEEAKKRVEARMKLRDKGMAHCFDKSLLRRFILTMNQSDSFDLSGLL